MSVPPHACPPLPRLHCTLRLCAQDAESKGAALCCEYRREGNLIWPMVVDRVTNDMR